MHETQKKNAKFRRGLFSVPSKLTLNVNFENFTIRLYFLLISSIITKFLKKLKQIAMSLIKPLIFKFLEIKII